MRAHRSKEPGHFVVEGPIVYRKPSIASIAPVVVTCAFVRAVTSLGGRRGGCRQHARRLAVSKRPLWRRDGGHVHPGEGGA